MTEVPTRHPVIDPATGVRPVLDELYFERNVVDLVRKLTEGRGQKVVVAALVGLKPQSLSHTLLDPSRERHRRWTITEVAAMADHFKVTVDVFVYHDHPQRLALVERSHAHRRA